MENYTVFLKYIESWLDFEDWAKPLGPDFAGFRWLINFELAFRAPFVPTVQISASLRGKYRFSLEYLGMSSSELGRL